MRVLVSSETNEWYTPPDMIEAVRDVLGGIDLDPASHAIPQKWIKAKTYFIQTENGLLKPWKARTLFLNPPYGKTGNRSNQDVWMEYLISQLHQIGACVALTKTVPGYVWYDDLFNGGWPGPMCITRGRLRFVSPSGLIGGMSKAASTFWYYGTSSDRFADVFGRIGRVLPRGDKRS